MPKESTKDVIIKEALRLFAEKGFAAVSMRDLAEAVGISASTIYHYYESKQVLFEEMIRQANELTVRARDSFFQILGDTEKVECEPFVHAGLLFVTEYLRNERIDPLLRMLESERFHNPAADEAWKRMLFADPLEHEKQVFEFLSARGEIRESNPETLAAEYHGIIMLGYFTSKPERMADALRSFYGRTFVNKDDRNT